jgi:hypothetical protein
MLKPSMSLLVRIHVEVWIRLHSEMARLDGRRFERTRKAICCTLRIGEGEGLTEAFDAAFLYALLGPQDGVESALARLIVALTSTTMECLRRASTSDALPVRDLELNCALKGALVMSTLTKALDHHREKTRDLKRRR